MLANKSIDKTGNNMIAVVKQKRFMVLDVITAIIALLYLFLITGFAHAAVPSLELFAASGSTSTTGPILAGQERAYLLNANNPSDNNTASFTPNTTVTLGISNQQYSSSNFTTTGAPGGNAIMFGGEGNSSGDNVATATIFVPLSTKGNPAASVFTSTVNTPASQGVSVSANYGTRFFVSTEPLQRANLSRTGRHYMGDITVTFSRPIVQPVIHVGGLGGTTNDGLGFSAEFDLVTGGFTLAQLSGSSELTVNTTQILNNSSNIGSTTGSGGASGSIVINGGAVSSVTFRVYIRGDGTGNAWDSSGVHNGDAFVFSAGSMDASVDLSAVKTQRAGVTGAFTPNDTTVAVGNPIQYQLVLTNNGPQYVTNATFTDALPNALNTPTVVSNSNPTVCPSPSFSSGRTLSGTFTGTAGASCTIVIQAIGGSNADITNTVSIAPPSSINDLDNLNDSDSVKTRIGTGSPTTDVAVSKTDGLDSIAQGTSNTYTIRVTNYGANPVIGALLKDPATSGLTKTGTPTCTVTSGNSCTASSTNALLESTGIVLPTLAANGGFYEITIRATVGNVSSITNTASADVGTSYVNSGTSCTSNNGIIRSFANGICNSADTTSVLANGSLSFDSAIKEARLAISPNVPTIWRGGGGQQTITITNNGPDTATNAFATYTESLQTGVNVGSVTLSNGTACSVSSSPRVWRCPLGTLSNGSVANFLVNYTTTTTSTLGNGQTQAIVRAGSDELNPGSGVGESAYRIWGSEAQQTTPSRYGAFMVGYNGAGGTVTGTGNGNFGPYSYEGSSIEAAWPVGQNSPTGGYLNNGIAGLDNSKYLASSTTSSATVQRLLTTLTNIQVFLPREDNNANLTDNRRAWELKTGALIPVGTTQNVTLCIGNSSQKLDDSAYVILNGVRQGSARDTFVSDIYTVPITLNAGYNVLTYRIANRNSTNGVGGEVNEGGFNTIGLSSGSDCLPSELNTLINQGAPAKINIIDAVALVITKTNSSSLVNASGQTTYSVTVENQGPSDMTGAVLKDPVASNMSKGIPVCSTSANNQCTAGTTPTAAQLQSAGGYTLPKLSSGQKYVLNVPVTLNANTVTSVTNTASVQTPLAVTSLGTACINDTTNGYSRTYDAANRTCTTSDTDSIRAHVRIIKTSVGGVGSFSFTLTNTDVTDETITTVTSGTAVSGSVVHDVDNPTLDMKVTENAISGFVLTSASCIDSNAANSGNPTTAIGTLSGSTITIPPANLKAGADLQCSFTNSKQRTLTLRKTWVNARVNDAVMITATGLNSFASIANTANETDTATAQTVNVGSTVTLGENISTGAGLYDGVLACNATQGGANVAIIGNDLIMPDADVICGYTNTIKGSDLAIDKTGSSSVTQGSTVSYTIKVWNKGPTLVSSSTFTDNVPAVLTGVTWSCMASGSAACGTASGTGNNINVTTGALPVNNVESSPTSGSYLTFSVSGTAGTIGNISNTASIAVTSGTDPVTANNSSSASTTVNAPAAITPDTPQKEARFTITPDLPTIYRGQAGTQLVTIKNEGPDDASGTVATFKPRTQTGVTVTSVKIAGGANCSFTAGEWSCPVGSVANGGSFQLEVGYDTTTSSTLGTAIQADIRVNSNEFNPGSGVGEILYRVWGSTNPNGNSQLNEIRPNGAFALGYGTANANENVNLSTAWTTTQINPTGAYLTQALIGSNNSVFGPVGTYEPMISRIITNLNSDPIVKTQTLLALTPATQAGDNRRAWELITGIYVPPNSNASLCIGSVGGQLDDSAYIMLNGAKVGTDGKYNSGSSYIQTSVPLLAGYNRVNYRIANRNTPGSNEDFAQGLYGEIGLSINGGACTAANLDSTARLQVPASINIVEKQVVTITGQVFEDNSGSTAVNSNAYNGIKDTGEVGIADSTVTINNCANTTAIATTKTDANGDYRFILSPTDLPAGSFCIAQKNLDGFSSVSGTTGYARNTDTITVPKTTASSYPNHNFGDARLNVVLTEDGQQTIIAGGVADYPHRLTAQSVLTVTSLGQTSTQQPANSTDAPWQSLLYRDLNCNGKVDASENVMSASLPLSLKNNEQVCLVQRVYAPATASMGAQHISKLQASFSVTLADATQITGISNARQDTTVLGSTGLSMQKGVRSVGSCPSSAADTGAFTTSNQAQSGGYLEYEITYRNNSNKNLIDVTIKDSVPLGTVYQSNSCGATPSGMTCVANANSDALLWQTTGILKPSQQGTVRFCTKLP